MILVDVHIVVWLTINPRKLPKTTGKLISDSRAKNTSIAIAGMTLWELAMLMTNGKIRPAIPLGVHLRRVEEMFQVLPVTGVIVERRMQFSSAYPNDPADRLIGTTVSVHGIPLVVTKDNGIVASREVNCVW